MERWQDLAIEVYRTYKKRKLRHEGKGPHSNELALIYSGAMQGIAELLRRYDIDIKDHVS